MGNTVLYGSQAEPSMWHNVFPNIVSGVIVIILFVIARHLDSRIRRREIKGNWYQKVIIDPNIEKINSFYKNANVMVKRSIAILVTQKTVIPLDQYEVIKSAQMGDFQELKRKFELDFVSLIATTYPEVAGKIEDNLSILNDRITVCYDDRNLQNTSFEIIENMINESKNSTYSILHTPFIFNKKKRRAAERNNFEFAD